MNAYDYWSILQGALATLSVSLASIALGVPLGLALALVRLGNVPGAQRLVVVYVSVIRACPAVTLILLIFFAMPQLGISLDPVAAGILALTLSTAAFNCEIWRSALLSFERQQFDAALAFGMPRRLRLMRIVLPQVFRSSLPGLVNEMTMLVKSSPAIAVIGIVEITRAAQRVGSRTYEPLPPFIFALVIYSALVYLLILLQRRLEQDRRHTHG
ncbi:MULTISPECIES: amino acid ABC transporter permease [Pseudomonas]|uniref:L-cystine transport system permease protein YecS n=1 Tax=Pseudomonas fluorescens TaxID=294 RepID=A0A5E6SQR9_PSEFL|nr:MULTISPECIES: amino acid ABC transporter permease [Pseudomonas]VVM83369.1 L-cystine transport system permease protein YecS [Pseudomonas fluorescens]